MAQRKRPVCVEDLYEMRRVASPEVSPDGRHVAYVQAAVDRESDRQTASIWIAQLDGRAAPRAFTQGPHAQSPRWSPDGRSLAFVANRFDVMPVWANDESCVVVTAVLWARARRTIVYATDFKGGAIESMDLLAILGDERQVQMRRLLLGLIQAE